MISITIYKDHGHYCGIDCTGHAEYADSGNDIVCSSVSLLVVNTINGIEQFTDDAFSLDTKPGEDNFIHFRIKENISSEAELLMNVLVLGLTEVVKEYGNSYVRLKFEEV